MSEPRPTSGLTTRTPPTANAAFRAGWKTRRHWSMVIAVAIHAAVFLALPAWERVELSEFGGDDPSSLELVAVGDLPGRAGVPENLPLSESEPEAAEVADEDEEEDEERRGGARDDDGRDEDARRADRTGDVLTELRRRTASLGSVVTPAAPPRSSRQAPGEGDVETDDEASREDPEPEQDDGASPGDPGSEEDDGPRIRGGTPSLSGEDAAGDEDERGLDRLSALRPDLAFGSPESWILIRNPSEVGSFLRERFGDRAVGSAGPGMLSVAIWVDERGSVEWAEIDRSSGDRDLDASALELFTEVASFRPARERGARVPLAAIFWLPYPW